MRVKDINNILCNYEELKDYFLQIEKKVSREARFKASLMKNMLYD